MTYIAEFGNQQHESDNLNEALAGVIEKWGKATQSERTFCSATLTQEGWCDEDKPYVIHLTKFRAKGKLRKVSFYRCLVKVKTKTNEVYETTHVRVYESYES